MGFFDKLKEGLKKTKDSFTYNLESVFLGYEDIEDEFYEDLEEILIMADLGVNTTTEVIEKLKSDVIENRIHTPADCKEYLIKSIAEKMGTNDNDYEFENNKSVVMVIGVNGVGKTTSIGKLAAQYRQKGKKVLIAAADTFRAAAVEQLAEWANRASVDIIKGNEGQDPASVVYDAVTSFKARNYDILLIDTAGRLHNKKNLMEELKKMDRIIDRECPDCIRESFVVVDATTGQNALMQAREFNEASKISGVVLTKLDGSAKGGIAIAIQSELSVPVKYIGVGEGIDDLQKFNPDDFVRALFDYEKDDKKEESL